LIQINAVAFPNAILPISEDPHVDQQSGD
jgi:hypothetical protein